MENDVFTIKWPSLTGKNLKIMRLWRKKSLVGSTLVSNGYFLFNFFQLLLFQVFNYLHVRAYQDWCGVYDPLLDPLQHSEVLRGLLDHRFKPGSGLARRGQRDGHRISASNSDDRSATEADLHQRLHHLVSISLQTYLIWQLEGKKARIFTNEDIIVNLWDDYLLEYNNWCTSG